MVVASQMIRNIPSEANPFSDALLIAFKPAFVQLGSAARSMNSTSDYRKNGAIGWVGFNPGDRAVSLINQRATKRTKIQSTVESVVAYRLLINNGSRLPSHR